MLRGESPWPTTFLLETFNSTCQSPTLEETAVLPVSPEALFQSPIQPLGRAWSPSMLDAREAYIDLYGPQGPPVPGSDDSDNPV